MESRPYPFTLKTLGKLSHFLQHFALCMAKHIPNKEGMRNERKDVFIVLFYIWPNYSAIENEFVLNIIQKHNIFL